MATDSFTHKGVGYCCKSPQASKEDMERIEKQPLGYKEIVDCINCRGQMEITNNKFGLHIGSLCS